MIREARNSDYEIIVNFTLATNQDSSITEFDQRDIIRNNFHRAGTRYYVAEWEDVIDESDNAFLGFLYVGLSHLNLNSPRGINVLEFGLESSVIKDFSEIPGNILTGLLDGAQHGMQCYVYREFGNGPVAVSIKAGDLSPQLKTFLLRRGYEGIFGASALVKDIRNTSYRLVEKGIDSYITVLQEKEEDFLSSEFRVIS